MVMKYTDEIKEFIIANHKGTGHKTMSELVNEKFGIETKQSTIKSFYANHNLNSGLTGRFEKGNVPVNKGIKGVCAKGCEKTWFPKGNVPANYRPIGSERITVDGYIEIKVSDTGKRWKLKHRVVWEQANGKVPPNHAIIFRDRNRLNTDLSNLQLITRRELQIINKQKLLTDDADLNDVAINIARVESIRNKRKGKV